MSIIPSLDSMFRFTRVIVGHRRTTEVTWEFPDFSWKSFLRPTTPSQGSFLSVKVNLLVPSAGPCHGVRVTEWGY